MIIPLECHTDYSIQEGFAKVPELVAKAVELKFPAIALTDTHSVSGAVEFFQEVEKSNKKNEHKIIPLLGCVICTDIGRIHTICKNKQGYYTLLKILSDSHYDNEKAEFSIKFTDIVSWDNLIIISNGLNLDKFAQHPDVYLNDPYDLFDETTLKKYPVLQFRPVFYINSEDKLYQNILLCSRFQCTLKNIKVPNEFQKFFDHDMSLKDWEGADDSDKLLKSIEPFSIAAPPALPIFTEEDADAILLDLCRKGWGEKGLNQRTKNNSVLKDIYTDRIKEELKVFKEANLANYTLIVNDIMKYVRTNGHSCGLRGSGVGCLIFYLMGISDIDPVCPDPTLPYSPDRELSFDRFYNWARNTPGNISLPDVDMDIPCGFRSHVIEHLQNRYGKDRIGYIITFMRLDGRGIIKEVFRITEPTEASFEVADAITKNMVDASKVQDILEDLKDEDPTYNIIQYNIDHIPAVAAFNKEYPETFAIALKMSGSIKNTGRHAAGIVIANKKIGDVFPIIHDKVTGENIVAFEMSDLEYAGGVKFDILGVAAYDKIDAICELINSERLEIEELI